MIPACATTAVPTTKSVTGSIEMYSKKYPDRDYGIEAFLPPAMHLPGVQAKVRLPHTPPAKYRLCREYSVECQLRMP
jgi:hypothetical protein